MNGTEGEFILLGLSSKPRMQIILFIIFFVIFICIIVGNSFILTAIFVEPKLKTPMYFFLSNLSFIDICFSHVIFPKMMENILSETKTISFVGCTAQMYLSISLGATECILLTIMAFDRYIAICNPLRHMSIMSRALCINLAVGTWLCGFTGPLIDVSVIWMLPFCGHTQINHFFCECPAVLKISCTDTSLIATQVFVLGLFVLIIPISLILICYTQIIASILKIRSTSGRHKAFNTCSSHITVVILFYGTAMPIYLKPLSYYKEDIDEHITVAYTVITPFMNPVIYTLRNKEVKGALKTLIHIICVQTQ